MLLKKILFKRFFILRSLNRDARLTFLKIIDKKKVQKASEDLLTFKKQFFDLKAVTQKDLKELKGDLTRVADALTSACHKVHNQAKYLKVNNESENMIHIGSPEELYNKLKKLKEEQQVSELQLESLTKERNNILKTCNELRDMVDDQKETIGRLTTENNQLKFSESTKDVEKSRATDLENYNNLLQISLTDISKTVLNDIDETDNSGDIEDKIEPSTLTNSSEGRIMTRSRSLVSREERGADSERRTRSASPGMAEAALTAVQTALGKRQIQVHSLKTKLATSVDKIDQLSKTIVLKRSQVESIEKRLEKEKKAADSLKIKLEEEARDKIFLKEKVDILNQEKQGLERFKDELLAELNLVRNEKNETEKAAAIKEQQLQLLANEKKRLENGNEKLSRDGKERESILNQLEKAGSNLRKEVLDLSAEVEKLTKELNSTRNENRKLNEKIGKRDEIDRRTISNSELEIVRKKEITLRETVEKLKSSNEDLILKSQSLSERLEKIESEELMNLKLEATEARDQAKEAREKLSKCERDVSRLKNEKDILTSELKTEQSLRDKAESELHSVKMSLEEVSNQLTTIQIEKTTLLDEIVNNKQDVSQTREQLDRIAAEHAILNSKKSELEVKLETMNRKMIDMKNTFKVDLDVTTQDSNRIIEELNDDIDDLEEAKRKLIFENGELNAKVESIEASLRSQRASFDEDADKFQLQIVKGEEQLQDLKEKLATTARKYKSDLTEMEDKHADELQNYKKMSEKHHKSEIRKLLSEKSIESERLRLNITELEKYIENLRIAHAEELKKVEFARRQALTMAQQDQNGLKHKNRDLTLMLDNLQKEMDSVKRDSVARSDRDRSTNTDLNMDLSKLKKQLEMIKDNFKLEKDNLSNLLAKEKANRIEAEAQVDKLKLELASTDERILSLTDEVECAKAKLYETEEENKKGTKRHALQLEQRYVEAKEALDRQEKTINELQETIQEMEICKEDQEEKLMKIKEKIVEMETDQESKVLDLRISKETCAELREELKLVEKSNSQLKTKIATLQGDYDLLVREHENALKEKSFEDIDETDGPDIATLRLKVNELETLRKNLEREFAGFKDEAIRDEKQYKSNADALKKSLEEVREREAKWEKECHNLESSLTTSRQNSNDLLVRLKGYEGTISELKCSLDSLQGEKDELATKLNGIVNVIQNVRPRPNSARRSTRRSASPWTTFSNEQNVIENVRVIVQDISNKMSRSEKEKTELSDQVSRLKRENEECCRTISKMEQDLNKSQLKISGAEEQLRKLEKKISQSDVDLANQVSECVSALM